MEHLMTAYGRLPVMMQRGSGANLFDDQGREYLDALSGIAVCSLGHANKALADALTEQVSTLMHISNLYREPLQEELGTRLCGIALPIWTKPFSVTRGLKPTRPASK